MDKMAREDYDDEDEQTVASQRRVVIID